MWLKLVSVDENNEKDTELLNLNNVIKIFPVISEHTTSSIYFKFSAECYTAIRYESASLCEKEFNRLLNEMFTTLTDGKNLLTFEMDYLVTFETNYYGGEKQ